MNHASPRRVTFTAAAALLMSLTASPALAVHAGHWVHDSEADFTSGKTEDAVVTNLGDVKLAAQSSVIGKMPEETTIVNDLQATADGTIYIAAGPQATLLIRQGDTIKEILKLEQEQIFTLDLSDQGGLLVGVSGEKSRLAVLEKDNTLKTLVDLPDTRYIWDMKVQGTVVYLATGTQGKLLKVDLAQADKPVITEMLDAVQANLLCLAMDSDGRIYAGSDTDGLVYRVSMDDKGKPQPFVVYDADEPEIGALWMTAQGTLYVGTADADQARPGRLEAASQGGQGRPATPPATNSTDKPDPQPKPPGKVPNPGDIPNVPPQPKPVEPPDSQPPDSTPGTEDSSSPIIIPSTPATIKNSVRIGERQAAADHVVSVRQQSRQSLAAEVSRDKIVEFQNEIAKAQEAQSSPSADKATDNKLPEPTAAQRDELRNVIRQRLEQARQSGAMQTSPGSSRTSSRRIISPTASQSSRMGGPGSSKPGNAVYRVSPQGFVSEVFRESVMILNITGLPDGSLLIATGSEGRLFRVDPATSEITRLVKLDPQQITSVLTGPDGDLLLGTANPATLARFSPRFATQGTFTSVVLDASQISLFGQLNIVSDLPKGTSVSVQTRSGNVSDPEKGPWSPWSKPTVFTSEGQQDSLSPQSMAVQSPPARFLQYQLTLVSANDQSPLVGKVDASFVVPNLKPTISAITLSTPGTPPAGARGGSNPSMPQPIAKAPQGSGPGGQGSSTSSPATMNVMWEASDANGDELLYKLEFRPANAKVWLPLAKDLKETRYEWQTRRVPDGRYVVRVTASDFPDNPVDAVLTDSRTSDSVLVDNTPPELTDIKTVPGKGQLVISGKAKDALSTVTGLQYVVDSAEQWQYILPDDLIYDSTDETFTVKILDLTPGQHVITLRADDARGNVVHNAVIVEIK